MKLFSCKFEYQVMMWKYLFPLLLHSYIMCCQQWMRVPCIRLWLMKHGNFTFSLFLLFSLLLLSQNMFVSARTLCRMCIHCRPERAVRISSLTAVLGCSQPPKNVYLNKFLKWTVIWRNIRHPMCGMRNLKFSWQWILSLWHSWVRCCTVS